MRALKAGKGKAKTLPFFCGFRRLLTPLLIFLFAFICPYTVSSQTSLPIISRLDTRDIVFRQFLQDVENARRTLFSSRQRSPAELAPFLIIYSYTPGEDDGLMAIAARCNIPYASLASLNRLSNADDSLDGRVLLLPSMPGIFIPESPGTDLENLLFTGRVEGDLNSGVVLSIPREGATERFLFIPGDDFTSTERVFFLNRGFRFPLQQFRVTSFYGPRVNPVTGVSGMHRGLDLAAPEGSEVFAVRRGTVVDIGEDPILGRYIIISHDNGWASLYGHLSVIEKPLRAEVQSGSLIGRVGSTGQSTGPHLHFELRQHGQSRDPARLLGLFRGNTGR